ncbi:hypothetical protein BAUCODRAFT_66957 [Baudoinia panamericana UAMH 10762]|uniref:NADH:ubiquinone oxidoreductase intermediate-associated protein 30 domain-containing protein n=1 Tax=Baudoinia panamericana (strain UAMH 10762) TaxID=717646 RepID=M2N3L6_BAUPA|nr:uncharacterized protein BAUCODRAFT_66957 [Baudoinia panamericana UAMH 10762]EMC98558.1 hypothetical protein BAUCODRAFT_66957 [Baudoinia panamericana UAMH 10762]
MPSFFRRSVDEFRRQARIAVKLETLQVPQRAYPLIQFDEADSDKRCKVMTDKSILGGYSTASLTYVPGAAHTEKPSHVLFKGNINPELPPNRPDVHRSGFAAWRTRDRGWSLFGKLLWDIDPYSYLALRIKSDGRKYFVNIQTESIVPTDLHQHLLPSFTPGKWETVWIPFTAFVRTNHGIVVEPQKEMLRQVVRSVGIGLTDRMPGPFELCIADIYATNREPETEGKSEESGFALGPYPAPGLEHVRAKQREKKDDPEKILI